MPDKKLGSDAVGYRKEIIKNETYLSGFTTSINQLLEKIGKKVINLGGDSEDQLSCKSTWTRDETNALGTKGKDQGKHSLKICTSMISPSRCNCPVILCPNQGS